MNSINRDGHIGIWLLLAVVGAATAFYFISAPFSTRVNDLTRQATRWTPQRIQKDPAGYLTWAQRECANIQETLSAQALALRTKQNEAARESAGKATELAAYESLLIQLKTSYRRAEQSNDWPVVVNAMVLTKPTAQRLIVDTYKQTGQITTLIDAYRRASITLTTQLAELDSKQGEASQLARKLSMDTEIVKVNKAVTDLKAISDDLNAILDTSTALHVTSPDEPVIADLVQPVRGANIEETFARIMSQQD